MDIAKQVRGYSFLSVVLTNRGKDPFCHSCHSFLSTVLSVKDKVTKFDVNIYGGDTDKARREYKKRVYAEISGDTTIKENVIGRGILGG